MYCTAEAKLHEKWSALIIHLAKSANIIDGNNKLLPSLQNEWNSPSITTKDKIAISSVIFCLMLVIPHNVTFQKDVVQSLNTVT